jgi:hypothetical protein
MTVVTHPPPRKTIPQRTLACPCGAYIIAPTDDELVELATAHLEAEHPGREYSRDEILFMAY